LGSLQLLLMKTVLSKFTGLKPSVSSWSSNLVKNDYWDMRM
jgi:hypothetical protein